MRLFGIDFAPFNVPLHRRLQTFAVLQSILGLLVFPILSILIIILLLFSPLFFIPIIYLTWFIFFDFRTPKRGGRPLEVVRRSKLWHYYRDYFPITMKKTVDLDPNENYLFGYHPHGIISCGAFCNFGTEATGFSDKFPGIKPHLLTLESNFRWPILRGYLLFLGLCDVSRESVSWLLEKSGKGNAVVIVVGGAEEALEAHPGTYTLTLRKRKGFVRMAIKTGAHLVPCFSFGENELFNQASNPKGSRLRNIQEKVKSIFGVSPPFFYGRGVFNYTMGIMPFRNPVTTIVGAPLPVVQNPEPTTEEVDKLHQQYLDALQEVFDTHKTEFGISADRHLVFE